MIDKIRKALKLIANSFIFLIIFIFISVILAFLLSLLDFRVPDLPLKAVNPLGYGLLLLLIVIQSIFFKLYSETNIFEWLGEVIWNQANNYDDLDSLRQNDNKKKKEFYQEMAVLNFSFAFFAFFSVLATLYIYGWITIMTVSLSLLFVGVSIKSLESGITQMGVYESYTDRLRKETLSTITSQTESLFIILSITAQFAHVIENSIYDDVNFIRSALIIAVISAIIFILTGLIYNKIRL